MRSYLRILSALIGSGIATAPLLAEEVAKAEKTFSPRSHQTEQSFRYTNPITRDPSQSMRDHMILKVGNRWYPDLVYEDTPDPYVEVGHNAVFEGPDGKDWICCHYWLLGKVATSKEFSGLIPIYEGTQEQLGIEPLLYENGRWRVNGPAWKPQEVKWIEEAQAN